MGTIPITSFNNPQTILDLQDLLGFSAVAEIVFTVFNDSEHSKPGCTVNAEWFQDTEDYLTCKQTVSEVLSREDIPHIFHETSESNRIFIGETEILQSQNYGFLTRFSKECTTDEDSIRLGRFLGVPDKDNIGIEQSERDMRDPNPVDVVSISDTERFYLRLLSWTTAATRAGIRRGVAAGRERFTAFERAVTSHPDYQHALEVALHMNFTQRHHFYGTLSHSASKKLYQQYSNAVENLSDDRTPRADRVTLQQY